MPLSVLLPLVVAGIGGIVLLLHLAGRSARLVLAPDVAIAAWNRHYPEDPALEAAPSADGAAALVVTETGTGLVWAMGADSTARPLRDFDVTETGRGLTVRFHDFTAPRVAVALDERQRRHWQNLMDTT